MKKFFSLTLTLAAMLSAMAVSAQAADYSFETDGTPEYYPSSSYHDAVDAAPDFRAGRFQHRNRDQAYQQHKLLDNAASP